MRSHQVHTKPIVRGEGERGLRRRGAIEEVKEECCDGCESEGNNIKGIHTVFNVIYKSLCREMCKSEYILL